jgi:hypothetical protein
MTTSPVTTITDELLSEIEDDTRRAPPYAFNRLIIEPDDVLSMVAELRTLRAENADIKQQLVAAGITAENCEAFRKDAERLDFISQHIFKPCGTLSYPSENHEIDHNLWSTHGLVLECAGSFRDAIDEEMQEQPQ